ncbi:MAG: hypothetical protein HC892_01420 [Saprospiraceae bacterium]|nr:hypothetical protein [Saprospiraceae bacterium]
MINRIIDVSDAYIKAIENIVCKALNINAKVLKTKNRSSDVIFAKHLCIYFMFKYINGTKKRVCRIFQFKPRLCNTRHKVYCNSNRD